MSSTIKREMCPKCNKKNLCTWKYEDKLFTKCRTKECEELMINEEKEEFLKGVNNFLPI